MVLKISSIEKSVSIGDISISQGEIKDFYERYHRFFGQRSIYNQYGELTDGSGEVLSNDMLFVNYQLFIASLPDDSMYKNISQSDYKKHILSGEFNKLFSVKNIPNCGIDSKDLLGTTKNTSSVETLDNNKISNVRKLILASIFGVGLLGSANMFFQEEKDRLEYFQGYTYLASKRILKEGNFGTLQDFQIILEKDFQKEIEYRKNEYLSNIGVTPDVNVIALQNGESLLISITIHDTSTKQPLKHFSFSIQ